MGPALDERRRTKAPVEPQREQPRAEPARDGRLTPAGILRLQREFGNQAVQRMVRAAPARPVLARNKTVIQAAYMSGDMFGICAALTLDPTLRVVILEEEDDKFKGVREEQSALYESFYTTALKQSGVKDEDLPKRIKRVKVKDTQAVYKELTGDGGPGTKWATLRIAAGDEPRSAGFATTVVGNKYEAKPGASQAAVRNAFTGADLGPSDEQLAEFVTKKGFESGKKYALLWIRLSAKEKSGGAHAELDTSIQGVRQLKELLKHTGRRPVLVGDRPGKDITADTIDMIKFWDEEPFKAFKGLSTRIAQLRMFEYMRKSGIDLLSIGMRSGAMEGPALLGIPTMYIEELGNKQHERMEKWKGKVPGWSQVTVRTLPTRTGKRYQDEGSYVPGREKAVDDAVNGVVTATGDTWSETSDALYGSYDADWDRFLGNVKFYWGGGFIGKSVVQAMGRWHRAYGSHRIVLRQLYTAEDVVVRETAKTSGVVYSALRDGGGGDVNVGLADYLRIVLPKLKPTGADPDKLKAVTKSIRQWRAIYVGKADLAKGFARADLEDLLMSPALRADALQHIKATKADLLNRIDALAGETAGTIRGRLAALAWAEPDDFVSAYLLTCATGLAKTLPLALPKTPTAQTIRTKAIAHGKTDKGKAWWEEFDAKLKEVRLLLYPVLS